MENDAPRLFVSYCWSSPEHEQWVLDLASELRENRVDVTIDKWDLKEGHDAIAFMEKIVTDPTIKKVIMVSDKVYAEKADGRSGGVGTETQIVSPEIYKKQDQTKFVAVLPSKDETGKPYLPTYYKSRIYIDLSDENTYAKNFEQLLRWIFDKPLYVKPELGKAPTFLSESDSITLGTTTKYRRAIDAIRNSKDYCDGAIAEYFEAVSENLEKFRIKNSGEAFDEDIVKNIEAFLPYRNEAVEIFLAISQYRETAETRVQLHRFFESIAHYLDRPEHVSSWQNEDFDNFKFIIHELFLYAIASLIKYERFEAIAALLGNQYYLGKETYYSPDGVAGFAMFQAHLDSLETRKRRLKSNRISIHADLLEHRSKSSGFSFRQIMQADFVLFLRDSFDAIKSKSRQSWWPRTLVYLGYHGSLFEIFGRAQSLAYFDRIKKVLGINNKDEFLPLFNAIKEETIRLPSWEYRSINIGILTGFEKLCSKT